MCDGPSCQIILIHTDTVHLLFKRQIHRFSQQIKGMQESKNCSVQWNIMEAKNDRACAFYVCLNAESIILSSSVLVLLLVMFLRLELPHGHAES